MAASKFTLMLRLRARYLVYSLISLFIYLALGSTLNSSPMGYNPAFGFSSHSSGQGLAFLCGVGVAIYLLTQGTTQALNFYSHNKIGKGRVARAFFRHRDVVPVNNSVEAQWQSTIRYSFFAHVIPANLYGAAVLLGLGTLMTRGTLVLALFYAVALLLLGKLSDVYANQHLCSDEINEMYERPQSYVDVVTQAKQEVRERISQERTQELLERERQRNRPPLPKSNQRAKPRKPY